MFEEIVAGIVFHFDVEDQTWYDLDFNYRFAYNNQGWAYSVYKGGYDTKVGTGKTLDDVAQLIISYERKNKIKNIRNKICLKTVI